MISELMQIFLVMVLVIAIGFAVLLPTLRAPKDYKAIVFILTMIWVTNPVPWTHAMYFLDQFIQSLKEF
jgi:hypothetical protein